MKLTLGTAVNGFMALQRLGSEKMPVKLAYNIQRNMRLLEPDVKAREEKRIELIKTEFGKEDDKGNWSVPPESTEAFAKEIEKLDSVEIDLDLHTFNLSEMNIQIAPNDLYFLDWMFVETPKE